MNLSHRKYCRVRLSPLFFKFSNRPRFHLFLIVASLFLSTANSALADAKAEEKPATTKAEQLKQLKKATGLKGKKLREHIQRMQEAPQVEDEKLQAYVTKIGERVLAQSEHAHLPYRFIVRALC